MIEAQSLEGEASLIGAMKRNERGGLGATHQMCLGPEAKPRGQPIWQMPWPQALPLALAR